MSCQDRLDLHTTSLTRYPYENLDGPGFPFTLHGQMPSDGVYKVWGRRLRLRSLSSTGEQEPPFERVRGLS